MKINAILVETMIEDAGKVIAEQQLQKERATLNKSVADLPYTGTLVTSCDLG